MKHILKFSKIAPGLLAGLFLSAPLGAAILALDFGANYTTTNINAATSPTLSDVDADFDGFADDRSVNVAFGTDFSPPNSPNWTTPGGKSGGVIKHGVSVGLLNWVNGVDPEPAINLNRISSADIIQVSSGPGTASLRMASAYYWEKASFVNGADSAGALSFENAAESISINFNNSGTPTNTGGRLGRALVQSNGNWFISDNLFGGTTGTIAFNGSTSDWYAFNPQSGTVFVDVNNLGSATLGSALTDITAVGIYTQHELINGTANNAAIQGFNGMQVSMVPEPSTYALVFGALVLFIGVRRRLR